jgi:hypothetical protein
MFVPFTTTLTILLAAPPLHLFTVVALLSADAAYVRRRGERLRRDAADSWHAIAGVWAGGKQIGHGVVDGVSGIVTAPYRGAVAGGVSGFLAGAARGVLGTYRIRIFASFATFHVTFVLLRALSLVIVNVCDCRFFSRALIDCKERLSSPSIVFFLFISSGLVVKPVTGVVDAVSLVGVGIKNTTTVLDGAFATDDAAAGAAAAAFSAAVLLPVARLAFVTPPPSSSSTTTSTAVAVRQLLDYSSSSSISVSSSSSSTSSSGGYEAFLSAAAADVAPPSVYIRAVATKRCWTLAHEDGDDNGGSGGGGGGGNGGSSGGSGSRGGGAGVPVRVAATPYLPSSSHTPPHAAPFAFTVEHHGDHVSFKSFSRPTVDDTDAALATDGVGAVSDGCAGLLPSPLYLTVDDAGLVRFKPLSMLSSSSPSSSSTSTAAAAASVPDAALLSIVPVTEQLFRVRTATGAFLTLRTDGDTQQTTLATTAAGAADAYSLFTAGLVHRSRVGLFAPSRMPNTRGCDASSDGGVSGGNNGGVNGGSSGDGSASFLQRRRLVRRQWTSVAATHQRTHAPYFRVLSHVFETGDEFSLLPLPPPPSPFDVDATAMTTKTAMATAAASALECSCECHHRRHDETAATTTATRCHRCRFPLCGVVCASTRLRLVPTAVASASLFGFAIVAVDDDDGAATTAVDATTLRIEAIDGVDGDDDGNGGCDGKYVTSLRLVAHRDDGTDVDGVDNNGNGGEGAARARGVFHFVAAPRPRIDH